MDDYFKSLKFNDKSRLEQKKGGQDHLLEGRANSVSGKTERSFVPLFEDEVKGEDEDYIDFSD